MIEIMEHGDKHKNYFPNGKKLKFICHDCGCVFKVTAPDESVHYYVNRYDAPGFFVDSIDVVVTYVSRCPECKASCLCRKKV